MRSLVATLLLALGACRPPAYVQPSANEPHATVEIRHVVHARRGPFYGASTYLGADAIDERTLGPEPTSPGLVLLRVRPEPAVFRVYGHSFHYERHFVQRSRQVPEPYPCYQEECSSPYSGGGSTCHPVSRTCTRYRTEYFTETVTIAVDDDACGRELPIVPRPGYAYRIEFEYVGNDCAVRCVEQRRGEDGTFTLAPCPIPERS